MILFTVFEYSFGSEFIFSFLGFLRVFELEYMFLELLLPSFMVDSCSVIVDSLYFMLMMRCVMESCFIITESVDYVMLLFRSGNNSWKQYTEPVRFRVYA